MVGAALLFWIFLLASSPLCRCFHQLLCFRRSGVEGNSLDYQMTALSCLKAPPIHSTLKLSQSSGRVNLPLTFTLHSLTHSTLLKQSTMLPFAAPNPNRLRIRRLCKLSESSKPSSNNCDRSYSDFDKASCPSTNRD